MFFIMGIGDRKKEFAHHQMITCGVCGSYGRYAVFMTYTVLSLFFIPVLKWNKQYYVRTSCCGTVYRLAPETGRRIAGGADVEIRGEDLQMISRGAGAWRRCRGCGYETREDFDYCPRCGNRF